MGCARLHDEFGVNAVLQKDFMEALLRDNALDAIRRLIQILFSGNLQNGPTLWHRVGVHMAWGPSHDIAADHDDESAERLGLFAPVKLRDSIRSRRNTTDKHGTAIDRSASVHHVQAIECV